MVGLSLLPFLRKDAITSSFRRRHDATPLLGPKPSKDKQSMLHTGGRIRDQVNDTVHSGEKMSVEDHDDPDRAK